MTIVINMPIYNDGIVQVATVDAKVDIDGNSNIHGYIDAFVSALIIEGFTQYVIDKGFTEYVNNLETPPCL